MVTVHCYHDSWSIDFVQRRLPWKKGTVYSLGSAVRKMIGNDGVPFLAARKHLGKNVDLKAEAWEI